jgi:hypothetical protein
MIVSGKDHFIKADNSSDQNFFRKRGISMSSLFLHNRWDIERKSVRIEDCSKQVKVSGFHIRIRVLNLGHCHEKVNGRDGTT